MSARMDTRMDKKMDKKRKRVTPVKKKKKNRGNALLVLMIAVAFMVILGSKIADMRQEDLELARKEQKLQEAYDKENERTTELEKQALYVQTKQYIEESAKKLGYVYPDEIIFKPKP